MKYTLNDFAQLVDHVNVKADVSEKRLREMCEEAKQYNFKIVAINSVNTSFCVELLKGFNIGVGAAISFPYGQTTIATKVFETQEAIQNGAKEIDYVINISKALENDFDYLREEMKQIVDVCHQANIICKVIIETSYLNSEQIKQLCLIAKEVKPDFVKTSTGTTEKGATLENILLIKNVVEDEVGVKASGGIRSVDFFLDLVKAGATRIGTSSGIKIIEDIKNRMENLGKSYLDI